MKKNVFTVHSEKIFEKVQTEFVLGDFFNTKIYSTYEI